MRFLKKATVLFMLLCVMLSAFYSLTLILPLKANKSDDKKSEIISSEVSRRILDTQNESSAVAVAAQPGNYKGKIKTEVISPYKAPLNFSKVYMKNTTGLNFDFAAELNAPIKISLKSTNEPEVLIFCTHTTECYMLEERDYYTTADATGTLDKEKSVVAVGAVLKNTLEQNGISVLQDTSVFDSPKFSGCYDRSAEMVKKYLAKYPSIKVVIDVHRDSITYDGGVKSKPTVKINGKNAAQVMIVSGCEAGSVKDFPNWRENLRFALKIQNRMETDYPTLARPLNFCARRYNQHLTTGSLLIEFGTEANTLEEAKYSALLVGTALKNVLKNKG